jgi:hypothetical protein
MGLSPDALYETVQRDIAGMEVDSFTVPPSPGTTYRQFAATYLLHNVVRKWIPKCSKLADAAALSSFTEANNLCKGWSLIFGDVVDQEIFGEIRRTLDDFVHPKGDLLVGSISDLLDRGRSGPGVSVGATGTSFYSKYWSSPLTTTSHCLYEEYRNYCSRTPRLSEAECLRYEKFGSPSVISGSRCSFVPKTDSTSRMICIEPSLNMFYQLGLASLLEERLKVFFGIDLATQPTINHRLAWLGSASGSFSTIDLSSASDSISLRLCESIFPKWFFELLVLLRSHSTLINEKEVPLWMMSTMGNGFTFPLQTIIFSAVLKACRRVCTSSVTSRPVACFGDDLICEKTIFSRVVRTLGMLGFRVNPSKTFSEGPFRESCGADWFLGQPVRPVFIKKLDVPFDYLVAINQLNEWSAYTGIPLRGTVQLLMSAVHRKFLNYVPFDSSADSGVRVPLALVRPRLNKNRSFLFKSWERVPHKVKLNEGEFRFSGGGKGWIWNPAGLYTSFLYGELGTSRKGGISYIMVSHNRKMYRRKLRCSPYWDYIPLGSVTNGVKLSWQQWETAVSINLDKT